MFRTLAIASTLALSASLLAQNATNATEKVAEKDRILAAMKTELERNKAKLVLGGMMRPYFMEYRVEDLAQWEATANFGAMVIDDHTRQLILRVVVRVGDYKQDSSTSRGDGIVQVGPEDGDPAALEHALWLATDDAYKNALRNYAAKQAALRNFQSPSTADDFTPAKPVTHMEPTVKLALDEDEWRKRIVNASGAYEADPRVKSFAQDIQFSSSTARALAVNRYLVNTEGSEVRQGYTEYSASVSVATQAPDGMDLQRDNGPIAVLPTEMESAHDFHERVVKDLLNLQELRKAPVVAEDDYHGPVLFSGDASTDIFNRIFVPNVEADKPDPGTTARTQGSYTSSYHARVLPLFLSATDDPLMKSFHGKQLFGSYEVDDEGTPAQKVDVAVNGILQHYLIDREPVKDVPESNGHGRAAIAQRTQSRSGVMQITSAKPVPTAALKSQLVHMLKDQKRDYVYEAETLTDGLAPRVLYRIYGDGHRELVRGAVFDELDQRSLRSEVMAAGDDPYVSMSFGPIPQTTIVPSLLFGDIVVKRSTQQLGKLPYYAPPPDQK